VSYRAGIAIVVFFTVLLQGCGRPPFHIVRPGETLYSISWRYDQDFHDLATWNTLEPPYTLRPGQSIVLSKVDRSSQTLGGHRAETNFKAANSRPAAGTADTPAVAKRGARTPVKATAPQFANVRPHWRWPVKGKLVHGFDRGAKGIVGRGLDIAGRNGDPVRSAAAGQVVYSGSGIPSYGNLLIIKHNERYLSAYAHNRRLLVREGERVRDGQVIAEMGSSGTAATQAMLHFEIRQNGKPVDPRRLLP